MGSYGDDDNPALIYEGEANPDWPDAPAPLVLIHDGGGTTFSYHCLDPVGRPLYGIHNSHFDQGGFWEGGVPQIAAHYIRLLRKAFPQGGDIILGGWSFGGVLSLEISHQLALMPSSENRFNVLGMVWVDTVFPLAVLTRQRGDQVPPMKALDTDPAALKTMTPKEKADINMSHARIMVANWDMPQWEDIRPPPTILLRAQEHTVEEKQSFVDHGRDKRYLGWEGYSADHGDFIQKVVDVEGHHFNLFEFSRIEKISEQIRDAVNEVQQS